MSLVTGLLSRDWWRRGITITARLSAFSSDIGFAAALREVNPARKEKASIIAWRGAAMMSMLLSGCHAAFIKAHRDRIAKSTRSR
jgi:hypothetical protein